MNFDKMATNISVGLATFCAIGCSHSHPTDETLRNASFPDASYEKKSTVPWYLSHDPAERMAAPPTSERPLSNSERTLLLDLKARVVNIGDIIRTSLDAYYRKQHENHNYSAPSSTSIEGRYVDFNTLLRKDAIYNRLAHLIGINDYQSVAITIKRLLETYEKVNTDFQQPHGFAARYAPQWAQTKEIINDEFTHLKSSLGAYLYEKKRYISSSFLNDGPQNIGSSLASKLGFKEHAQYFFGLVSEDGEMMLALLYKKGKGEKSTFILDTYKFLRESPEQHSHLILKVAKNGCTLIYFHPTSASDAIEVPCTDSDAETIVQDLVTMKLLTNPDFHPSLDEDFPTWKSISTTPSDSVGAIFLSQRVLMLTKGTLTLPLES